MSYGTKHEHGTDRRESAFYRVPAGGTKMLLTFAISLLFTAGAAFALLVIVGMLAGNRAAIVSALAGQGAFGTRVADAGGPSPERLARVKVGPVRRGLDSRAERSTRAVRPAVLLRAAA
jgi:hypothetical protein